MPIQTLTLTEAMKNRKSEISRWPSDADSQAARFSPIARPAFDAPFVIKPDDFVFTVGSCFARNIEKQLAANGFDFAARYFELSHDDSDFTGVDVSGVLNKYVVQSILNELRFAIDPHTRWSQSNLVELSNGKWWDPHLNNTIAPASLDRVLYRREKVTEYFKTAARADVFIMTLGLAEAWFDTTSRLYGNGVPPATIQRTEPNRFEFHRLDYNQILTCLEAIRKLLMDHGNPDVNILVTVSPVALKSTFSGQDAMIANTYSKAVQRAAVEAFATAHSNVTYFPSFESVTLSERSHAWAPDQLHASDEIVRYNVLAMMEAYSENRQQAPKSGLVADALTLMYKGEALAKKGQIDEAGEAFKQATDMAPAEGLIHMNHATFLLRQKRYDEAVIAAEKATAHGGDSYGAYAVLATAYRTAGRLEDAYAAIDRALEIAPTKRGNIHAKAVICTRMRRFDEALDLYETIIRGVAGNDLDQLRARFMDPYVNTAKAAGQEGRAKAFLAETTGEPA